MTALPARLRHAMVIVVIIDYSITLRVPVRVLVTPCRDSRLYQDLGTPLLRASCQRQVAGRELQVTHRLHGCMVHATNPLVCMWLPG